jgi:hypothetical protein
MTTPTSRVKRSQSGNFIDIMLLIPNARSITPAALRIFWILMVHVVYGYAESDG